MRCCSKFSLINLILVETFVILLLSGLVFFLCAVGGLIFRNLELSNEIILKQHLNDTIQQLHFTSEQKVALCDIGGSNVLLVDFCTGRNENDADAYFLWDWWGSTFFCLTAISTLGYGMVSPQTFAGQVFCIFYSLIGVMVFGGIVVHIAFRLLAICEQVVIVLLATVHNRRSRRSISKKNLAKQQHDCDFLTMSPHEIFGRYANEHNKVDIEGIRLAFKEFSSKLPTYDDVMSTLVITQFGGHEINNDEDFQRAIKEWIKRVAEEGKSHFLPTFVTTLMAFFFLFVGAAIFERIEGWTYANSLWFCLITLLAIGLGDFVPSTNLGQAVTFVYAVLCIGTFGSLMICFRRLFITTMKNSRMKLKEDFINRTHHSFSESENEPCQSSFSLDEETKAKLTEQRKLIRRLFPDSDKQPNFSGAKVQQILSFLCDCYLDEADMSKILHDVPFVMSAPNAREQQQQQQQRLYPVDSLRTTVETWYEWKLKPYGWKHITFVFCALVLLLFFFAFIFTFLEDWTFWGSWYYCWTTLLTIGFGDYVPVRTSSYITSVIMVYCNMGLLAIVLNIFVSMFENQAERSFFAFLRRSFMFNKWKNRNIVSPEVATTALKESLPEAAALVVLPPSTPTLPTRRKSAGVGISFADITGKSVVSPEEEEEEEQL